MRCLAQPCCAGIRSARICFAEPCITSRSIARRGTAALRRAMQSKNITCSRLSALASPTAPWSLALARQVRLNALAQLQLVPANASGLARPIPADASDPVEPSPCHAVALTPRGHAWHAQAASLADAPHAASGARQPLLPCLPGVLFRRVPGLPDE